MRLRSRLILLFGVFGVVPLLAIGAWDYMHSIRALDDLVGAQTDLLAARAAAVMQNRLDLQQSDIALLGENAETQRALRTSSASPGVTPVPDSIFQDFMRGLWDSYRVPYERIGLRDRWKRNVLDLEEPSQSAPFPFRPASGLTIVRPIRDLETGEPIGELELHPRLSDLLRAPLLSDKFGASGRSFVIEQATGLPVSIRGAPPQEPFDLLPPSVAGAGTRGGRLVYWAGAERRVVSFVPLPVLGWFIASTSSVDEFASPFVQQRFFDLVLLVLVVVLVSIGFFLLLRRSTRSLDALAVAAGKVGQGDFTPALPPPGPDEVGRLSAAFHVMAGRIQEMLTQVEASRQTALLGRFATELAHEIRNPLTAIKLHLQGLAREARTGRLPEESRSSVDMALREIHRLDEAVRTALRGAKPTPLSRPFSLHRVLEEAIALLEPEARASGVRVDLKAGARRDTVTGDPEAAKGAFLNLLLNAIQAMPQGGTVSATTRIDASEQLESIEIRIHDQGPGIPEEIRDRVFRPFFTTRDNGTGLGLSMAREAAQAHGGSLHLDPDGPGTEMVFRVPLAPLAVVV